MNFYIKTIKHWLFKKQSFVTFDIEAIKKYFGHKHDVNLLHLNTLKIS